MLNGALLAFFIMIAGIPIPVAHFILIPLGPFIGGFFGGSVAKADEGRIILFGIIVALLMFIPVLIIFTLSFIFGIKDLMGFDSKFLIILSFLLIPYTWFGVTVGALISYLVRRKQKDI